MRTKFGVVVLTALFVPFLQCSGGDDSAAPSSTDAGGNDATAPGDSGPIVDAAPVDSGPPIVTVSGTLKGRSGDDGPLASRDVVIVDANGVVTKTTTDANGNFGATGVQTPYGIGVPYVPLDAAAPAYPRYYAGISRADPIVTSTDYNQTSAPVKTPQSTTLSFTANVCSGCELDYGGPDYTSSEPGSGVAQLYAATYSWKGSATYSAPLHFYLVNASGAFVSALDLPATALTASGITNLSTLTLATITNGTLNITNTIPSGYTIEDTNIRPSLADGTQLEGGNFSTLTGVANFPKVAGLSVEIDTSAGGPDGSDTSDAVTYAEATAPATLAINLLAPPTPLLPANHATGVTDTQSLTWAAFGLPVPYQLLVSSSNGSEYLIYTTATSLSLSELAKAEVPLDSGTTFTWQLAADGYFTSMDDLTSGRATIVPATLQGDAVAVTQTFSTQ